MKESVDLVEEIRRIQPSSRVLFTTFKYSQSFFEKYVFSHFRGRSLPLVLVDYYEYQRALRDSGKSQLAGTRYLIDSVLVRDRTFHPKMVVACSDEEIRILVGSSNLTPPGYAKNAEICSIETIPFDKRQESPILFDTCDFLLSLKEHIESKVYRESLEGLVEKIDLNYPFAGIKDSNRLLHNLGESIFSQIRKAISEDVKKVTVVSPFFSQSIGLYDRIADDFTENIEFVIQPCGNNLPVVALENWRHVSKLRVLSITFKDNRYLHGKIFLFHTSSAVFALAGSANCTESALLFPVGKGGNIEVSLFRKAKLGFFEYLFDPSFVTLKSISVKEVKPVSEPLTVTSISDFRVLEVNVVGDQLVVSFDYELAGKMLTVKVHVDSLSKDFVVETNSNVISLKLSQEDKQALTASSIVSLTVEDGEKFFSSDLRLIHNPLYFPEQFSALNSILDEDEKTWLFKILSRYAGLPSFDYVLPIIQRLDEYGFFESGLIKKEEILWELQSKLANIRPYSSSEQIVLLIDRFKKRHEKRMESAMVSKSADQLQTLINSFVMINKLIIWLVRKGYERTDYLRFLRKNVEDLFSNKYFDALNSDHARILLENKLLAYLVLFSHVVDFYQRDSPQFQTRSGTGRNYLKEAFETTFILTIQMVREIAEERLKIDAESLVEEFADVSPEIDFSFPVVIGRLNELIKNFNMRSRSSLPPFN